MGMGSVEDERGRGMPPLERADAETVRVPPPSEPAPTTPIDDSRFTAGTLLAGRYRIVGRIGSLLH